MPPPSNFPLARGYQLLNYTIVKQLSAGGFSIVYLAHDEHDQPVAIKEYLPNALALRSEGERVMATSADNLALFRHGMKCFFEEGKTLAQIRHPNIVKVVNFFRANETVYMVMEYERGRTLQKEIQLTDGGVKENLILYVFAHLLNGLREVHLNKMLHLDIKPANLYIRRDGSPVLLDFGSARDALSPSINKFTPMYTPGFASPEQYADRDKLGPWSDIYSVGASIFACMSGLAPQAADQRAKEDKYQSVKKMWAGRYSESLLELVDWCLMLDPLARPQSVRDVQKALVQTANEPQAKPSRFAGIKGSLARFSRMEIKLGGGKGERK
ncbi:serine/threonine protein kinase [Chitinimonas arctica]|uniref:non-specific serine/threonine protein kinase n=1 Tax=Chitinimonas arctica TaxID=2594795 RepID=A0A516SEF5_9NEIS|nr:serine/threonine-protein kinase [Chitinimonas arctica]QDQ26549.1 serine/threonine protein kinase [Chitinimonas arctica]